MLYIVIFAFNCTFLYTIYLNVTASSNVNKPFMCLDSAPLAVGTGKSGSNSGEGSPPHSSDEPGLLESNVSPPQSNMVLRKRIRKIKQGMKRYNSQLTLMRRDLRNCKAKIAEQQKQIVEYATRLDENDKKNEETSRKFSTLLQVFTKVLLVLVRNNTQQKRYVPVWLKILVEHI